MTDSERIAELERKVELLLTETSEQRAERENEIWKRKESARNFDLNLKLKQSRLAEADSAIAELEPYKDALVAVREETQAKRNAVVGDDSRAKDLREALDETLLAIDGVLDWHLYGDVVELAKAHGVKPKPGCIGPLEGRVMLPKTMQLLKAWKTEREIRQRELDELLAKQG